MRIPARGSLSSFQVPSAVVAAQDAGAQASRSTGSHSSVTCEHNQTGPRSSGWVCSALRGSRVASAHTMHLAQTRPRPYICAVLQHTRRANVAQVPQRPSIIVGSSPSLHHAMLRECSVRPAPGSPIIVEDVKGIPVALQLRGIAPRLLGALF